MAPLGKVAGVNLSDGFRITAKNGESVRFPPSGKRRELRVSVEVQAETDAQGLLDRGLTQAAQTPAESRSAIVRGGRIGEKSAVVSKVWRAGGPVLRVALYAVNQEAERASHGLRC